MCSEGCSAIPAYALRNGALSPARPEEVVAPAISTAHAMAFLRLATVNRSDGRCHICGLTGHKAKFCPQKNQRVFMCCAPCPVRVRCGGERAVPRKRLQGLERVAARTAARDGIPFPHRATADGAVGDSAAKVRAKVHQGLVEPA